MRRLGLFLVFAIVLSTPLFAQQDVELNEIQAVIEKFEQGFAWQNLDSMLSVISKNYLYKYEKGEPRDYLQEKVFLEGYMEGFFKKHTDYSFSELKIVKSEVKDNKVIVWVGFKWKAFNLDTAEEVNAYQKRYFSLKKENGEWKIIGLGFPSKKSQSKSQD